MAQPFTMLLVEDDDTHAELFHLSAERSLEDSNIERAHSLAACFEKLDALECNIILLDLGLPECDGLETLSRLLIRCSTVPVIVLTAISDLDLGEKSLQMGAMDYLSKDEISDRTLLRSVRYSLERWKQKKALESSLADLEYFGHAAAHDLISPLNAIQGFARLIELGLADLDVDKEVRECLAMLKLSSHRASSLVSDLHKFARLGRKGITLENVDLSELAEETRTTLRTVFESVNGKLHIGSLPVIRGDKGLLAHVMQNLIGNALKYGTPGKPPVVEVESERIGGRIAICVRDNGIGIDSAERQRVFQPFERLQTKDGVEGSGLGLSICKRIIDAHEGRIWVESRPGSGSSFYFYLGTEPVPALERRRMAESRSAPPA